MHSKAASAVLGGARCCSVSARGFVDGAQRYLDSLPEQAQGWLGAPRDRQIGAPSL